MASAAKALWVAGVGFVSHDEALKEDYDGDMLRPSDMKQIITRFYNTRRNRRKENKDAGGMDLTHEHVDDDVVGDVHDMYISKGMQLMNIARISPGTETSRKIIERVTKRGKPVGLSYDFVLDYLKNKGDDSKKVVGKYIRKLSVVSEPDHHNDGTYITEWDETEEGLLKKLFGSIYGPDADEEASKPFYIANTLRSKARSLFEEAAAAEDDPMEVEEEKQKAPDAPKPPKTAVDQPVPEGEQKEVDKQASDALFTKKSEKDGSAADQTDIHPQEAAPSRTTSLLTKEKKEQQTSTTSMADKTEEQHVEEGENDAMDIDGAQAHEAAPPKKPLLKKSPVVEGRKTETGATKRPFPSAKIAPKQDDAMEGGQDEEVEENQDEADGEEEEQEAEGEEQEEAAPEEPAGKKLKTETGKAKKTSSYGLNSRDADIQLKALNDTVQETLKLANLVNGTEEDKNAFITDLFEKAQTNLKQQKSASDLVLKTLLADAGMKDAEIDSFVEETHKDAKLAQATRTLVAAAATSTGFSHRLREIEYQNDRAKTATTSLLEMANSVYGHEAAPAPSGKASIFNTPSSGAKSILKSAPDRRNNVNLDFSQSIFSAIRNKQEPTKSTSTLKRTPATTQSTKRLGGSAPSQPSAEELAKREEEKNQESYRKEIEKSSWKVTRTIPYEPKNPLFSIRDDNGEVALDSFEMRPELLENIIAGSFTHHFMNLFTVPAVTDKDAGRVAYGNDKVNESYYNSMSHENVRSFRAPRVIRGGNITIGDIDEVRGL